uniref:Uncharacterized protein n=1 Tax=Cacopsylla melanoneura TaxID=428564 RepID=A0A8D8V1A9_9HEMI
MRSILPLMRARDFRCFNWDRQDMSNSCPSCSVRLTRLGHSVTILNNVWSLILPLSRCVRFKTRPCSCTRSITPVMYSHLPMFLKCGRLDSMLVYPSSVIDVCVMNTWRSCFILTRYGTQRSVTLRELGMFSTCSC